MGLSRKSGLRLAGTVALVLGLFGPATETAQAQGFSIYEHGTCTMARGGATVADPCDDGSAVFYNPAGIAGRKGLTVSGGVVAIAVSGSYTHAATDHETELDNDPIYVPHLYLTYGFTDRLSAGLGVYVPYGLGTVWPIEGFEGRFSGYDNSLQTIYVQPTVAYEVMDGLSLGAGVTYANASVELNRRLDLSTQIVPSPAVPAGTRFSALGVPAGYDFADARMKANNATGFGAHFGARYQPNEQFAVGARYMMPIKLKYEGEAIFTPVTPAFNIPLPANNPFGAPAGTPLHAALAAGGAFDEGAPLGDQDVTTEITMPGQFVAGIMFQPTTSLKLFLDYQLSQWSSFEEITLDLETAPNTTLHENYRNVHGVRLGVDYALTNSLNLRGGFLTHGPAAPDQTVTPLLPEAGRYEFTLGFGWRITDMLEWNVAYQRLNQHEREGRVSEDPTGAPPTTALNSGTFGFGANLFGTTLTVRL